MRMYSGTHPRGMTLVEILAVIGVIVILGALLFPILHVAQEKGRQTTCLNNQRQIATALIISLQDNNGYFPVADKVWQAVGLPAATLICPDRPDLANGYVFSGALAGTLLGPPAAAPCSRPTARARIISPPTAPILTRVTAENSSPPSPTGMSN